MNVQRQLISAAIRAEAKRYEGVKVQLNKLFRLVELVDDPELKSGLKASLCVVRAHIVPGYGLAWRGINIAMVFWLHSSQANVWTES
ncbi:UNVERIFIED_CONTAM: hypothetical protein K2H54_041565 [Gekko kuhli]